MKFSCTGIIEGSENDMLYVVLVLSIAFLIDVIVSYKGDM